MRIILRSWLLLAAFLGVAFGLGIDGAGIAEPSVAAPWQADLVFFRAKLVAMHPDPFRKVGRARFEAQASALDQQLRGATREQAIFGMMRLVASLGDGHTSVLPGPQFRAGFHVLPLRFYLYGQDLILDGADRAYTEALGGKLTRVNGVPATDVIRRIREAISGDNPSTVDGRLPSYVVVPEVLAGVGVVPSGAVSIPVTLEIGGKPVTIAVAPVKSPDRHSPPGIATSYTSDWVDRSAATKPMWLRSPAKPYWFHYDAKSGAFYLQYNSCASDPSDPMPKFAARLEQVLAKRKPRRVIVDLRLNPGGEGYWNRYLLKVLFGSPAATAKGRMFALIGRQTFSAGNMMAIELEKYTATTFVGEPSGGSIQGFGNHELVFLPHSGLGVMIATKFYQNDGPNDDRQAIVPQVTAPLTVEDYAAGRDPALEAALRFRS